MEKTDQKRKVIIEKVADQVLAHGLSGASLRQLAAAAEMSDRMLLHYFVDKEELLNAALACVAERMIDLLASTHLEQMPFKVLVPSLAEMLRDSRLRPYMKLWLELAASAAADQKSHAAIAQRISSIIVNWIQSVLKADTEGERVPVASFVLAIIEGFVLLDAIDCGPHIKNALEGLVLHV